MLICEIIVWKVLNLFVIYIYCFVIIKVLIYVIYFKKKNYFGCFRYIDINKFIYFWKVLEGNFEDMVCYVDYEVLLNVSIFFWF